MSSVRKIWSIVVCLWYKLINYLQKIPVSIKIGRDQKNPQGVSKERSFIRPSHNSTVIGISCENIASTKKLSSGLGGKYKFVAPKVKSHWSPEEKERTGLRTFFERKEKGATATNRTLSPEMFKSFSRIAKTTTRRTSLPTESDPITMALENIRNTPILQSYSTSSSTNSSYVSLPENNGE